jgi:hypothetical protein
VVDRYVEGAGQDPGSLDRADLIAGLVAIGYVVVMLAAAAVFIIWLWRGCAATPNSSARACTSTVAFAVQVVALVNQLQVSRPWIPWWATAA